MTLSLPQVAEQALRDLLHLAAILTIAAYMAWLAGNAIVGAAASLINAWREDREHFRWAAEEIAEKTANRPAQGAGR
jgi:hypothetical protein